MAPLIPSAKVTLSYPLYACDFDPLDPTRLVVGGGGGAGRSGVGNKITVLNASNPSELVEGADIDLSKSEDNVASLAVGQRRGNATPIYAGVNSSPGDVGKEKNLHFRTFEVDSAGAASSTITEVSRSTLFTGTEADTYQRVLRLSRPYPNQPQLGAVTTGLAKKSELVVFDTSSASPPTTRATLKNEKEIEDVDFIQTGDTEYLAAYCNEHDVYVKKISPRSKSGAAERVYITPASKGVEKPTVPKFRALRWLTKDYLLMLTNIHSNGGAVLQILRLPEGNKGQCRIAQSLRLPSSISKTSGLAISNLTPPTSPSAPQDYTQFAIAVVGQDISISLFKVDLKVEDSVYTVSKIKSFRTLKSVHPFPITNIAFSNFTPPAHPVTARTPPQYLKLASVSVGNTAIVHTLPLFPVPLSVKKGQSKTPRYVVALPSTSSAVWWSIIASVITITLVATLLQGILEVRGGVRPYLNAPNYIPATWQQAIGRPYSIQNSVPEERSEDIIEDPDERPNHLEGDTVPGLSELADRLNPGEGAGVVVVREADSEDGVTAGWHEEEKHGPHGGREWDALSYDERETWKRKLKIAGNWTEEFGQTVLKGLIFGELAGVVAEAV